MENLFSIYTVKRSLSLFPSWVLTGKSTAWIHSAGSWYHCSHLPYSSKTRSSLLAVQRSTVGDLKRKDVFIEPRPVRCVWSLMSPVTFMWHSIKDGEADKLFNKPTCFGQGVHYDVAAGLQYYGRNLPSGMMWRWVRHPPSLSANIAPHRRREWFEPRQRDFCTSSLKVFTLGRAVFSAREGILLSNWGHTGHRGRGS